MRERFLIKKDLTRFVVFMVLGFYASPNYSCPNFFLEDHTVSSSRIHPRRPWFNAISPRGPEVMSITDP